MQLKSLLASRLLFQTDSGESVVSDFQNNGLFRKGLSENIMEHYGTIFSEIFLFWFLRFSSTNRPFSPRAPFVCVEVDGRIHRAGGHALSGELTPVVTFLKGHGRKKHTTRKHKKRTLNTFVEVGEKCMTFQK